MPNTIPFPDGKEPSPDRRSRFEIILDEIFQILPATSAKEIQERLISRGERISLAMVAQSISHLRKNADYYGWSIPHVKRGRSSDGRLYFYVFRDKTGSFSVSSDYRDSSVDGLHGTVSHIANMGKNEAVALRMVAQFDKNRTRREAAMELVTDVEYVAKKARALMRRLNGTDS